MARVRTLPNTAGAKPGGANTVPKIINIIIRIFITSYLKDFIYNFYLFSYFKDLIYNFYIFSKFIVI
jgi:hypothetical protein